MPSVVVVNFGQRGPALDGGGPRSSVGSGAEYLTFLRDDGLVTTLLYRVCILCVDPRLRGNTTTEDGQELHPRRAEMNPEVCLLVHTGPGPVVRSCDTQTPSGGDEESPLHLITPCEGLTAPTSEHGDHTATRQPSHPASL